MNMENKWKSKWMCNLANYFNIKNNKTSDVTIFCSDGTVQTHKLILVSISELLCSALKEIHPEEGDTIVIPDVSADLMTSYLQAVCLGQQTSSYSEVEKLLNVKILHSSKNIKQEQSFEFDLKLEEDSIYRSANFNDNCHWKDVEHKQEENQPIEGCSENDELQDNEYCSENDEPQENEVTKIRGEIIFFCKIE